MFSIAYSSQACLFEKDLTSPVWQRVSRCKHLQQAVRSSTCLLSPAALFLHAVGAFSPALHAFDKQAGTALSLLASLRSATQPNFVTIVQWQCRA